MRKLIRLKEGDKVPDGAKFVHSSVEKVIVATRERLVHSGWISNYYQNEPIYEERTFLYYELEVQDDSK